MNFNLTAKEIAKGVGKGVLGMTVAGTLATGILIKPWEGRELCTYIDPVGIPTVCDGITDPSKAVLGQCYSNQQCDAFLAHEVNEHERRLDQCLHADMPDLVKASFISWTFNVGTGASCRSTLVRKANAGDLRGACNELSRWTRAGGRVLRGLENRRFRGDAQRVSERTVCLIGLGEKKKSPIWESAYFKYQDWKGSLSL